MPKSPRSPPKPARTVEVLVYPAVQILDVTGPIQVFATANDIVAASGQPMPYEVRIVGPKAAPIVATAGLQFVAEPLPPPRAMLDTLVVAGGQGAQAATEDAVVMEWVRRRAKGARRIVSVCTGAYILAAAGVLDGRRAATHWSFCADLRRRYPNIHVESDPIFLRDGPVWTSAGVTAGIDLTLALVEEDLGRDIALAVARYLVVFLKRPGGQAQFSAALSLQQAEDRFGMLHDWIGRHLDRTITLPLLAEQAGMSERSFSRHYTAATGMTPARAVERLRVEAARRLLSESRLPVKRISQRCGFGSEETMRRSFLRLMAVSPQDYRARFSA